MRPQGDTGKGVGHSHGCVLAGLPLRRDSHSGHKGTRSGEGEQLVGSLASSPLHSAQAGGTPLANQQHADHMDMLPSIVRQVEAIKTKGKVTRVSYTLVD